eukprot:TRINITY_DN57713_c0_g1_i1.p1 TRINITY_DN57713_c0_g1~~TRINITY_DN57713_c0_g1_i1.p1  ORF type:complete len:530 (+),score=216.65 TRINITY_DN57713_c0_g1_i1:64-1590(+)
MQTLPPGNGRVTLRTSLGDVCVELWPNEAPVACRNFVQHCVNQYYDGCRFHRVVKGLLVQAGDPTGTGTGGRSTLPGGAPFPVEASNRLKFASRGMVAMAGEAGDNRSQFFVTLGPIPAYHGKYTIFGRVTAETIYPVANIGDLPCDGESPQQRVSIISTVVDDNPFEDIVAQDITRPEDGEGGDEWRSRKRKGKGGSSEQKPKKSRTAVKNKGMLSFGDEEDEAEQRGEVSTYVRSSRVLSAHDLYEDSNLSKQSACTEQHKREVKKQRDEFERKHGIKLDDKTERLKSKVRGAKYGGAAQEEEGHGSDDAYDEMAEPAVRISDAELAASEALKREARDEQQRMREEILKMKQKAGEATDDPTSGKPKTAGARWLDAQNQKFTRRRTGRNREKETILKMESWRRTLQRADRQEAGHNDEDDVKAANMPMTMKAESYATDEDNKDWFRTKLKFVNPDAELADKPLVDEAYRVEDPLLQGSVPDTSSIAAAKRQRAEENAISSAREGKK